MGEHQERPTGPAPPAGRLGGFLLVCVQLALILVIVRRFDVADQHHFFPVLCVAVGGYLVHAWLPPRLRAWFFALLSLGTILFVLGWPNGAWVIGIGAGLVAVCYLPVPLLMRVTLVCLAAFGLTMARFEYDAPFWPLLGSLFMFRMIVYLFEQRRATTRPPLDLTVAYFFPLPNVCFLFFPILDFKTFRDTYRSDAPWTEAQTGVDWIARGLLHLLAYRVVKYFVLPAPHELADLPHLALFLAANYALYLHVSGYFHIITGLLRLFGFGLPRTHDNYFLASSVTDIWRRINIYWKDFMSTVFFFPAFFALRGLGTAGAIAVAAVWVFVMTWLLHAYQVFWITGSLPLRGSDAVLWLAVGVIVAWNLYRDLTRHRRPARGPLTVRAAAIHSLKVVGTFALVSLFWAAWNAPAVLPFVRLQLTAGSRAVTGGAVVVGVLLGAAAVGTVLRLAWDRLDRLKGLPPRLSPAASGVGLAGVLACVAVVGVVPPADLFSPRAAAVVTMLRSESATPMEAAMVVQGYYEEVTNVRVPAGDWLAALEGRPNVRTQTQYTDMSRPTDPLLERELIPNWTGEVDGNRLTINRHGMRDRPDRVEAKPPDAWRIAAVGSSVVMGYGVGDDETFCRLLEVRLKDQPPQAGRRFEVLNFGTGRSHVIQRHVLMDRKGFAFQPDVMLYFVHQDEFRGAAQHLARLAAEGVPLPYPSLDEVVRKSGYTPDTSRGMTYALIEPLARDIVLGVYRHLIAECRRRGVAPVWVYLPMPGIAEAPARSDVFVKLAAEAGFTVVDLSTWADGHRPTDVKAAAASYHPNALGHRLIAERLEAELRRRPGLLPPGRGP